MHKVDLFQAHQPVFDRDVTHDLTNIFKELVEMAGLLDTEIHQIQDQWQGKKKLCATNHVARGSAKDLYYFQVVSPIEFLQNHGPKGDTLPWSSKVSNWTLVLSLVQEGGSKWGPCGESLPYQALPPQADLWEMLTVLHDQFRHITVPCPGMSVNMCSCWQAWQRVR